MIAFLKKLRQAYGDLKLQTKITIVLMIAVTVPVLLVGILFYGRFYNMVILILYVRSRMPLHRQPL